MSEATEMPSQTLEQTLNKTDLGHTIYENRKILLIILVAILVGAVGFVLWKQSKYNSSLENSVKVYEFQTKVWNEAKAGKVTAQDLVKSFESLDQDIKTAPVMLPIVLEIGKFLYEKGSYAEAEQVLGGVSSAYTHPVSSFFISMQRAVVLEKLGKVDEAIALLEKLAAGKEVVMQAKVSVDLGRLYMVKGEKAKAQTQFEYVTSTFPNDEQAKIAKLYLSKLAQK